MNLIEEFKAFQEASRRQRLSANARSLYVALLGEFYSAGYVEELALSNVYLQELSGIRSTNSFASARAALQNVGLIHHKKGVYRLQESGKATETGVKGRGFNKYTRTKAKEKDGDGDAREPQPQKFLKAALSGFQKPPVELDAGVLEVWKRCEGVEPDYAKAEGLKRFEVRYGADLLKEAILKAKQDDRWGYLTLGYVKLKLEQLREGLPRNEVSKVAVTTIAAESWEDAALEKILEA